MQNSKNDKIELSCAIVTLGQICVRRKQKHDFHVLSSGITMYLCLAQQ